MQPLSRDELRTLLHDGDRVLVEALPQPQYDAEHLPAAVNVPDELTAEFTARLAADRNRTIATYCSGEFCGRSRAAAAFARLGLNDVRADTGGKADWAKAGLPLHGTHAIAKAS